MRALPETWRPGSAGVHLGASPSRQRSLQACPLVQHLHGRHQLDSIAPELRGAVCGRRRCRQSTGLALVVAHYRFPHPVEKDRRLTGSKSKKVIRLWQAEVAREEVRRVVGRATQEWVAG